MDDRNRKPGNEQDYRDRYARRDHQDEQFSPQADDQFGETSWRAQSGPRRQAGDDFDRGYDRNEPPQRKDIGRASGGFGGDTSSLDAYDRFNGGSQFSRPDTQRGSIRPSGPSADFGSFSPTRSAGGYETRNHGSSGYDTGSHASSIPPRQFDRDERGFFDRASDEVMSWIGDDDARRRRQMDHSVDHRGKGPAGYTRSNERVLEDANERLMHDRDVDASKITVACEANEITLNGTVSNRAEKRRAEEIVDDISGVKHVQNNLRVETGDSYYGAAAAQKDEGTTPAS